MKPQVGFTLVEIAIVLVVIGLLLGGVLKGQELVLNAQIRNSINDFNNVASARFAYQDRYRAVPGDDITAFARWNTAANPVANGNGDGALTGRWDGSGGTTPGGANGSPAEETVTFWHHLRNDNLIAGPRNASGAGAATFANPQNSFNGITGVQEAAFGAAGGEAMLGDVICQSAIPARAAVLIDTRMDDGSGANLGANSGGLMATADLVAGNEVLNPPSANYGVASRYIMCREL